ncbi:MAG: IMP dehydrogenase [Planctomycetes bacterium]|nr:IMP dehydrogenase [Planctomycetota bacterium]
MPTKRQVETLFQGATFDDLLLRPQWGVVDSRREIDLTLPLAGDIVLCLPLVGANMDTVTGPEMAKALALEGGIGFLHRNQPIGEEARGVTLVKRQHAHIIEEPKVLWRKHSLGEARRMMELLSISGILLEEKPGSRVLAGILSHRDVPTFAIEEDAPVDRFMTPFDRLVLARPDVTLEEAERLMYRHRKEKLPLVDRQRRIRGLITMRDLRLAKNRPYSTKDGKGRLRVGAAIGARGDFLERARALLDAGADCLLMDVAHAHSTVVEQGVRAFRRRFPGVLLVCGNVGTGAGARFLAGLGVAAVKVGIGPGRGCRTRLETGAGVPQLQAIREAYLALGRRTPLIADGGMHDDKDIALAVLAGASTVMLGSALAGTDEAPGVAIDNPATGQRTKLYRGMTSPQAVLAGALPHEAAEMLSTPQEGQSVELPYRGSVHSILARIRGHLQSAVSYAGEASLAAARAKIARAPAGYFVRLTEASRRESFER